MQWEQLSAPGFEKAVKDTGVCILSLGVMERHSDHLPLGTDFLVIHRHACMAAEREAAVVFPPFYFGQIYEARCFPGALTIKPTLLMELLQAVMDEIGRNGFQKIILYNGHGGNNLFLRFLAQCSLWEQKPYSIYLFTREFTADQRARWDAILETPLHGHACECETSLVMASFPDLVDMGAVPQEPALPLNRMGEMSNTFAGIGWYADFPEHYAGDARLASAEKGKALREIEVEAFSAYIAAVKADQVVPGLEKEFFTRERLLRST